MPPSFAMVPEYLHHWQHFYFTQCCDSKHTCFWAELGGDVPDRRTTAAALRTERREIVAISDSRTCFTWSWYLRGSESRMLAWKPNASINIEVAYLPLLSSTSERICSQEFWLHRLLLIWKYNNCFLRQWGGGVSDRDNNKIFNGCTSYFCDLFCPSFFK